MARRKRVFLDGETGGTDETIHPLIEVAYALEDGPITTLVLPHDVRECDEQALRINGYDERSLWNRHGWASYTEIAVMFTRLAGSTMICANPAFDERFLLAAERDYGFRSMFDGVRDPWAYRKIDIESYAMPLLGYDEPRGLATIHADLVELGHDIPAPTHGAASDVDCLRQCWNALEQMWVRTR